MGPNSILALIFLTIIVSIVLLSYVAYKRLNKFRTATTETTEELALEERLEQQARGNTRAQRRI